MNGTIKLILASQSPRRAELLRGAGVDFEQRSPPFSDPDQPPEHLRGPEAEGHAAALARQKAASLAPECAGPAWILAADTICVDAAGQLIGKPAHRDDARVMLRRFENDEHCVVTGVALLHVPASSGLHASPVQTRPAADGSPSPSSYAFADTATVTFGDIPEAEFDAYLTTEDWRGKAGGYNLFDRRAAGWPITVAGDPTTVVGLPMRRLVPLLREVLGSKPR